MQRATSNRSQVGGRRALCSLNKVKRSPRRRVREHARSRLSPSRVKEVRSEGLLHFWDNHHTPQILRKATFHCGGRCEHRHSPIGHGYKRDDCGAHSRYCGECAAQVSACSSSVLKNCGARKFSTVSLFLRLFPWRESAPSKRRSA